MPNLHDLEIAMEALDQFLMSDQSPHDCMMLCDLDGFLTGIAIGPELIMPSEWLPLIWGGEEPVFDGTAQAQAVIGAIMARYNEILGQSPKEPSRPSSWKPQAATLSPPIGPKASCKPSPCVPQPGSHCSRPRQTWR